MTLTYALQSQCTVTTLVAFIACLRIAPHLQQCVCPVMCEYTYITLLRHLQAGEAIQLECECRGDLALRHHSCAVKWAHVKGDNICDICKQPIKNLPDITPRAPSDAGSDVDMTGFDDIDAQNHPHGLHGRRCHCSEHCFVQAVCKALCWMSNIQMSVGSETYRHCMLLMVHHDNIIISKAAQPADFIWRA